MKVAFDNQIFNWSSYGGVSRYFVALARELLSKHAEVKVYAGFHCNQHLSSLPKHMISGVKLNEYPAHTKRFFQAANHIASNCQIRYWQPDVVHETYYAPFSLVKNRAPRVSTVHDMIYELYPKMFSEKDRTSSRKRNSLEKADQIISVSQNTKADLIDLFGIQEDKITVVHHGVDFEYFSTKNDSVPPPKRPFFLFVGNRGSYKNFNKVLQVLNNSHRLKGDFDVVAFGGGAFSDHERALISGFGFNENQISQVGGNDDTLKSLYRSAAALLYPSIYEGFGMPLLEAMASSCPVICSGVSALPEVAGRAAQLFDPADIDSFTQAIEDVVYSPSRSQKLISFGLKRSQHFSWERCAVGTIEVYKKALR